MKTRLVMTLANAGVPVDTVTLTAKGADITYMDGATEDQRKRGGEILAAFDWSAEADAAWQVTQQRGAAKQMLTASDPMPLATRAACLALMLSLQECRTKVNEIVTVVNAATGSMMEHLQTGDSLAVAMEQVAQLLDAGAV